MSSKTKIIVLHMKEVIYTVIFLFLTAVLIFLLFFMFGRSNGKSTSSPDAAPYIPGIYNASVKLGENSFNVEVTVDASQIKSIRMVNLSQSTAALFPLMEPVLDSLASQIYTSQSLEDIQYSEDRKYTSMILLDAISQALKKAENPKFSAF